MKIKKPLVIGMLIYSFSLSLWNCHKDENLPLPENTISTQLQSIFIQNDLRNLIPYDYKVDWSNPVKSYSEDLQLFYYEFPVNYTSLLNPNELNKLKQKRGYYTKYKILAVESNEGVFKFYATKFYQNVDSQNEDLINSDVTFSNLNNYSGIIHLIDKEKKIVYTKKIDKGSIIQYSPFKTKKKSTSSLTSKNEENCETVRITYYTEWYKVYTDENGKKHIEYTHRQITGYDFEETCVSDGGGGFPEMDDYAPNGAGVYKKTGNKYVEEEIAFIDDQINNCPGEQFPNANGDCVDSVYDKVIDSLTGKSKCVYNKLKALNGNLFKKTIGKFIKDPKYNLVLQNGNCVRTDHACTDGSKVSITGEVTIIIEDNTLTDMDMAATILHEGIHAELWKYVAQYKTGINPNDKKAVFEYYKHYAEIYGDVFQGNPKNAKSKIDHIYMTQHYINPISSALRELDNNKYPVDYYKSFAWDGLRSWDPNNTLKTEEDTKYYEYRKIVDANSEICND